MGEGESASERLDVAYTPLRSRLQHFSHLTDLDLEKLDRLPHDQVAFDKGDLVVARGEEMNRVMFVVSGWASRSRHLKRGGRQIVHILLPGDILTTEVLVLKHLDHEIEALTDLVVRFVMPSDLMGLLRSTPHLTTALWWATEQEDGMLREAIVRIGRRSAIERLAHLLLEIHRRLLLVHQATDDAYVLPISQEVISDALGLSQYHVSTQLRELVEQKLVERQGSVIRLTNIDQLADLADFDISHLHLGSDSLQKFLG